MVSCPVLCVEALEKPVGKVGTHQPTGHRSTPASACHDTQVNPGWNLTPPEVVEFEKYGETKLFGGRKRHSAFWELK